MSENSTGVTVTLKVGTGFEAPWIVIHANDASDALAQINTGDFATLAERTVSAAEFFRAAHNVKTGLPTGGGAQAPAPQAPPQQQSWSNQGSQQSQAPQQEQPQGEGRMCAHGPMQLRHSKPGATREWSAYMCPTPKGSPGQCSPIDAKTGKAWGSR